MTKKKATGIAPKEKLWGKVASARGEDTVCPYVTSLGTV